MPISATVTYSEKRWTHVQQLLHRAIKDAGLAPQNVWENTKADRVSERIIGNIFDVDVAIADVTDQNPNVMLELGLRLASRKPTIVTISAGSTIPFDIRDHYVKHYPPDLNIIETEVFLSELTQLLIEVGSASAAGDYRPFIKDVVVDVLSPDVKTTSLEKLILDRLDRIEEQVSKEDTKFRASSSPTDGPPDRTFRPGKLKTAYYATIPHERVPDFLSELGSVRNFSTAEVVGTRDGQSYIAATLDGEQTTSERQDVARKLKEIARPLGGFGNIPGVVERQL